MKFWNVTGYLLKGAYSINMRPKYQSKCKNLQNVTSLFKILHQIFRSSLYKYTCCFTTSAVVKLILAAVIQTTHI